MTTCPTRRRALHLALAAAIPLPLRAQGAFPDRPLRLVVGFPPGSGPDVLTRLLGQRLAEGLKQQVVVDNRPGAGGQIGTQAVAKAAADGYTLLVGEVGSIAIAPPAFSRLPYDPARELAGLAELVRSDFVLLVPAGSPHRTVADLVRAARAARERVPFATFGAGTPGHFGAEEFAEQAGFKVEPIHYRATGDAVTAIAAGDVQAAFVSTALAAAQLKGGKLRALATTARERAPQLPPEVPTFAEAGFPKLDFAAWFVVFAPAGTPAAVQELLERQLLAALQAPELRARLQEAGFSVVGAGRAATQRMLEAEARRWTAVVRASGFKGD